MKEMNEIIPESVIKEAKGLIALYGTNLKYLGELRGYDIYQFVFPNNSETGFPFLYIYDKSKDQAMEITGFDALDMISEFKKQQ